MYYDDLKHATLAGSGGQTNGRGEGGGEKRQEEGDPRWWPGRRPARLRLSGLAFGLLLFTALTPLAWTLGDLIDPNGLYDLFRYRDTYQKLHWYFHLSALKLENTVYTAVILLLLIRHRYNLHNQVIVLAFMLFSLYRIWEYWSFRYDIGIVSMCVGLIFLTVFLYAYKHK